ncbi:MAG: DUF4430 domain-containing protein [Phycisphaerae bacterium]|nr:DUF4430 domain-containing protein [Phycisphaerae bacterium]
MSGMNRRRAIVSIGCFVVGVTVLGLAWPSRVAAGDPSSAAGTVRLVIDYGDGVEKRFNALRWAPEMTVRSAMMQARALPAPRGLVFESKGEGERCMVSSIDGLSNEGAGQGTRNWLFWVNGEPGEKSHAVTGLRAGDSATWRFTTYDALRPKP